MGPRKVMEGIDWVGAVDWDRRLFDELVPLPEGTSYNAWVVRGSERTALFDTVDPSMAGVFMDRLQAAGRIDLLVSQHAEQDHAGCIPMVLERWPGCTVLASRRGKDMLVDELHIDASRVTVVEDGETMNLGGVTAQFMMLPWVHWPETFGTWIPERRAMLTCDLFGSHLATSDVFATDEPRTLLAAKRYFAEIMMPFRSFIERHMARLAPLPVEAILPSHGPAHRPPAPMLEAYREWVSGPPRNLAAVMYVSMHGSTRAMVERLVEGLTARSVPVRQVNLTGADLGEVAMTLLDAATIVFATPTVLAGAHPTVAAAAFLANALKPKARQAAFVGSYGWGPGKAADQLVQAMSGLKLEWLPPVMARGLPRADDLAALDGLADAIAARHAGS